MSGFMRENSRQNMHSWNSKLNADTWGTDDASQDDATSQYSEDSGSTVTGRSPNVLYRLSNLFKNQLYTDVKFVISCGGVKPKPSLEAHRAILASGSAKFAAMLFGEKEIANEVHPEIQINNIPFEAFKNVVEYLYTDEIFFTNDSVVMDTLVAARTFQVDAMVSRCESYFESMEITEDNACTKYHLSTTNKMESLKNRCALYIQENTRAVFRSQDFKSSFLSTVRNIYKLPKFNLRSEREVFDAAMEWVNAQTSDSQSRRRELIEPLLKHIRFLTMSLTEFTPIVEKYSDIIPAKDAISIVVFLTSDNKNAQTSNLPTWCNKSTTNRCALVNVPQLSGNRRHIADEKVTICLKPIRRGYLNNLINVLELKCLRGNYQVKGLKLAFGDPVTEQSCVGHMSIFVNVKPSEFKFTEHIKIDNSKEVVVPFTKNVLVRGGNTLCIRAEASEVRSYFFLQFDEENSFSKENETPFECSLGSVPKENRLFFISEVMYVATQPRAARNFRNFRGGKKM